MAARAIGDEGDRFGHQCFRSGCRGSMLRRYRRHCPLGQSVAGRRRRDQRWRARLTRSRGRQIGASGGDDCDQAGAGNDGRHNPIRSRRRLLGGRCVRPCIIPPHLDLECMNRRWNVFDLLLADVGELYG
jgi:hypothetical protein